MIHLCPVFGRPKGCLPILTLRDALERLLHAVNGEEAFQGAHAPHPHPSSPTLLVPAKGVGSSKSSSLALACLEKEKPQKSTGTA